MKKNMGTADRIIRLLIAAVIAYLFLIKAIVGTVGIVLGIIALVFVFTSILGKCPLYAIFGMNTCKTKK